MGLYAGTQRGPLGFRSGVAYTWHRIEADRLVGVPETGLAFVDGSSFAVRGAPIAEDAALIEAGLDLNVTENATLAFAYQGQMASDAQEHGFNAKLGVRF